MIRIEWQDQCINYYHLQANNYKDKNCMGVLVHTLLYTYYSLLPKLEI